MEQIIGEIFKWKKKGIPLKERVARRNLVKVFKVRVINPDVIWSNFRKHDVLLLTGDAWTLPDDVRRFEDLGIPHDVYCVNRSMLFFQRPVQHWAAVDAEESAWFSENLNDMVMPNGHRLWRHTIGILPIAYDFFWEADNLYDTEYGPHIWMGNTGYFGILSAIEMGYKKIVIAGMPLDNGRHFYDPEGTEGPNWIGRAYTQWMDFKIKKEEAGRVKSMSGYTAFILGEPTKEWINDNGK